jgi:hypothetical protein
MKTLLLVALLLSPLSAAAQTAATPLITNEFVTVWNVAADALPPAATLAPYDAVVVFIEPAAKHGEAAFIASGGDVAAAVKRAGASRVAVISLRQRPGVTPNTSGYPDGFPRPGALKKPIDNARVTAWDYTFARDVATPMHFHGRDTVTVYLKGGTVIATTPDGTKTANEFTPGTIRFNPRNRTHTEMLVSGESHIVALELK